MKSPTGGRAMRAVWQPLERLLTLVVVLAGAEKLRDTSALEIRSREVSDDLPILGDLADSAELQMMQQRMDRLRLETEREVYEKKLRQQMDENAALARTSAQLEKDVAQIKTYNSKLEINAKELREGNEERRKEVKLLSEQLENSASLMRAVADTTDSSQYKELEVLKPSAAFIQIESDEKSEPLSSLAQDIISDVSGPEVPSNDVQKKTSAEVPSNDVQKKTSAEASYSLAGITQSHRSRNEQEEELKRSFLERKKVGDQKHEELLRQVEALNKTLVSQKSYADRLIAANKRLKQIRSRLDSQLKEAQQFMRRMDGYVQQKGIVAGKKTQAAVEQLQALKKEHSAEKKSAERLVNKNPNCASWAARGECKRNPRYMLSDCSAACAEILSTTDNSIPKIIHQLAPANQKIWPDAWFLCQERWKNIYSDYKYMLWNDEDIDNLVKTKYPNEYGWFKAAPMKILRIDAARAFVLHAYGGIYADMDFYPYQKAQLPEDGKAVLVESGAMNEVVQNSFMASKAGHPFWSLTFKMMSSYIQEHPGVPAPGQATAFYVLNATGPWMLGRALKAGGLSMIDKLDRHKWNPDDGNSCTEQTCFLRHISTGCWGITGGKCPGWSRDLSTEKQLNAAARKAKPAIALLEVNDPSERVYRQIVGPQLAVWSKHLAEEESSF